MNENGELHSVNAGIRKDVDKALNSEEYYQFQSSIKHEFSFIAPSTIGLTGCITFTLLEYIVFTSEACLCYSKT